MPGLSEHAHVLFPCVPLADPIPLTKLRLISRSAAAYA